MELEDYSDIDLARELHSRFNRKLIKEMEEHHNETYELWQCSLDLIEKIKKNGGSEYVF